MREELKQLREAMKKRGITVYYQPYSDAHGSEEISARDQSVRKISGFTGDSCTLVVLEKEAFLWTDSRFFVQANIELKDSGVSVTVLMPGPTDTEFFHRAGLDDTVVGQAKKMDAGDVAKIGYHAMQRGEGDVVAGVMNKVQAAMAAVTPQTVLAEMHRKQAEPGSAN